MLTTGGSVVKNAPANAADARDAGSITGSGRSPGEGHGNPLQYSCLGQSHRQRSLVGYSPWGCKESDRTEHTCTRSASAGLSAIHALTLVTSQWS